MSEMIDRVAAAIVEAAGYRVNERSLSGAGGFIHDARAMACAAIEAFRTWQPIETAPKDGTKIDVYGEGRRFTDVSWTFSRNSIGERLPDNVWDGWVDGWSGNYPSYISIKPTHWMPLPPPPEPILCAPA